MAAYEVYIRRKTLKVLQSLRANYKKRIETKIDGLADEPRPPGSKKLATDEELYRVSVGDYRIIYSVDDGGKLVVVLIVAKRDKAYKHL